MFCLIDLLIIVMVLFHFHINYLMIKRHKSMIYNNDYTLTNYLIDSNKIFINLTLARNFYVI